MMNMNIWTVSAYTCVGGLGGWGDMNGLRISTAVSLDTDTVGCADYIYIILMVAHSYQH